MENSITAAHECEDPAASSRCSPWDGQHTAPRDTVGTRDPRMQHSPPTISHNTTGTTTWPPGGRHGGGVGSFSYCGDPDPVHAARGRCNTSLLPHHRQQNWTSPRAAGSRVNATGRNGSHYIGRGQSKTPGHSPTTGNNLACPRRWRFEASRSGTPASPPCPSARGSESLFLNKYLTVAHGRDLKYRA